MNGYGTIQIWDDVQNWSLWGGLVESWVHNPALRPGTVGELRQSMQQARVSGCVKGSDSRPLKFEQDDPDDLATFRRKNLRLTRP